MFASATARGRSRSFAHADAWQKVGHSRIDWLTRSSPPITDLRPQGGYAQNVPSMDIGGARNERPLRTPGGKSFGKHNVSPCFYFDVTK